MGVRNCRKYTTEERAKAVALAREVGDAAAARELGLPKGTVSCWKFKANGEAAPVEEKGTASASDVEAPGEVPTTPVAGVLSSPGPEPQKKTRARRVAKVYTPSERARALEYAAEHGPTEASRKFGVSRFSLHDWQRKTRLAAEGAAVESPVVGSDSDPRVVRDQQILAVWKKHVGLGPSQIRNQLYRHQSLKLSVNTVRRVLEENGYVAPKVKRRSLGSDERFESVRPNHMWHLDFFHRFVHKQKVFVLLIIDDFSRFIVGHFITDAEHGEAVLRAFESAVGRHGKPEWVMSDGGSGFYSWKGISQFTRYLEELGCDHIIAKTPQVNGKSEILNANVQKELFNVENFFDLNQASRRLDAWISFYNLRRTHQALGGLLVPGDRYFGRADQVLRTIEAGTSPEGVGDVLNPAERVLDLLKVTSEKGQVAVTLMGSQIWPPRRAAD